MKIKSRLIVISAIFILLFCECCTKKSALIEHITFLNSIFDTEPSILSLKNNSVVFSGNNKGYYELYALEAGKIQVIDTAKNAMKPFLYKGKIVALKDRDGDENFVTTNADLNKKLNNTIKSIFSFDDGYLLLLQLQNQTSLEIFDLRKNKITVLEDSVSKVHSVAYCQKLNCLIISADKSLIKVSLDSSFKQLTIAKGATDESMTPFVDGEDLYFSANDHSSFYCIYKISLSHPLNRILVLKGTDDLKMPMTLYGNLFYIEIKNHTYLLKYECFKTGKKNNVTEKGVVYNYRLLQDQTIAFTYADPSHPTSLFSYDLKSGKTVQITGATIPAHLTYNYVQPNDRLSGAYIVNSADNVKIKGVILCFHPGLHADFSPRWDSIISNLAFDGFTIVVPNYPMSTGSGSMFYNLQIEDASKDMNEWKKKISKRYPKLPLYYLSFSSGNELMEHCLKTDSTHIKAAGSLFGIHATYPINPNIPTLYILGVNDPIINYYEMHQRLGDARVTNSNVNETSFPDEGHWFRKNKNVLKTVARLNGFFNDHK